MRWPYGAAMAGAALLAIAAIGLASWRALVAAGAGAATYYAVYNVLFFVVHGNQWSLSSFNSEDLIGSWMNQRMIEAISRGSGGCGGRRTRSTRCCVSARRARAGSTWPVG